MHTYTAVLHQLNSHNFQVDFPDFPELHGSADSLELVQPMAEAILANQLEELREQGIHAPEPLPMHITLEDDPEAIALLIQVEPDTDSDIHTHIGEITLEAA